MPFTAIALLAATLLGLYFHWVYSIRFETAPGIWQSENRSFIGALFMVLAVASAFAIPQWRAALGNRGLVFLSTISYNLYLWHQAIGVLVRKREWWPADTPIPTDDPTWRWSYTLVAVALSVLVATLITYLFERPLLRNGVRPTLRRLRLLPAERSAMSRPRRSLRRPIRPRRARAAASRSRRTPEPAGSARRRGAARGGAARPELGDDAHGPGARAGEVRDRARRHPHRAPGLGHEFGVGLARDEVACERRANVARFGGDLELRGGGEVEHGRHLPMIARGAALARLLRRSVPAVPDAPPRHASRP